MATSRLCSIPDCGKAAVKRGWCDGHYQRWRNYGNPLGGRFLRGYSTICSIPDCGKPHLAKGLCSAHWHRRRRGADMNGKMRASVGEPFLFYRESVVPYNGDECLIWPFALTGNGYANMMKDGHNVVVSRLICEETYGEPPTPKHEAAHSCGNGHLGCVNKKHLRWATPAQNQADRVHHRTDNRGTRNGRYKHGNYCAI